jgi:hypothetical protein
MRNKILVGVLSLLLIGCSAEVVENLDSGRIITGKSTYRIIYNWQGQDFKNYFDYDLKPGLDWIKEFLDEDDKILSWWDYGHMVRGYTGIDVVLYAPSRNILNTVADKKGPRKKQNPRIVTDVALALVTEDHKKTLEIMGKYDATHLLITKHEEGKAELIAGTIDMEITDNSIITRGYKQGEIPGFLIAYKDDNMIIYEIRSN